FWLPLSYCGTLSVSLTAASSPKGRAKRGFAVSARQITIYMSAEFGEYVHHLSAFWKQLFFLQVRGVFKTILCFSFKNIRPREKFSRLFLGYDV
ncbi:MAG: hypothetical protein MR828_14035, partial [Clostridiales bacterium]|nr:hypothetical protein [Clostridiales bacterium]